MVEHNEVHPIYTFHNNPGWTRKDGPVVREIQGELGLQTTTEFVKDRIKAHSKGNTQSAKINRSWQSQEE
ncbi:MAG: hypothetical protein ABI425_03815 [Patescibacteria group bacterium]